MSAVTNALPLPPLYYLPSDGSYWKEDEAGKWIRINEGSAMLEIRLAGFDAKAGTPLTEAERCRLGIQTRQNIVYAAPLAGYRAGLHRCNENDVLVTESPRLLVPQAGEWPNLRAVFEGLLGDPNHDQLPYFYGWLKRACESVRRGQWLAGQALALAGPVGGGKSLTQNLITVMLGGRSAKPYLYMTGATSFNGDLFRAEHLMVEDEAESRDIRARRRFAASIKSIAVNRDQSCHPKNRPAVTLTPRWRLTISLNDDPERLLVLPPLNPDVADKIILLKTRKQAMPMPTETPEQQAAFWNMLVAELPAFLAFLDEWEIPAELRSQRFGVIHFHHPEVAELLRKTAPEYLLLELIDQALGFGARDRVLFPPPAAVAWDGSALELKQRLTGERSPVAREASRLLDYPNACGQLLGRLQSDDSLQRVSSRLVNGQTRWTITPPLDLQNMANIVGQPCVEDPPRPPASLALAA